MKKLGLSIGYLFIAIYSVIFFAPKINLYYQLEVLMKEKQIVITQEDIVDKGFSLSVEDGRLYYGDLLVAEFDKISILSFLIFNQVTLDPVVLSKDMEAFFPRNIQGAKLTYIPFNPLHVSIESDGDFGSLQGDIHLGKRTVFLNLEPSKMLLSKKPFWMKKFKKNETGGYQYATNY